MTPLDQLFDPQPGIDTERDDPQPRSEVALERLRPPLNVSTARRMWRWRVSTYQATSGDYPPGEYRLRRHLASETGWSKTWIGAAIAIARRIRRDH